MYVYFDIDERTMLTIRRKAGRDPALSLPVSCGLPDEQGFTHRGKMDAADSRIDPATGTARWRAVLPNQDGMLSPGMFVRVRLETSSPFKAVLVPERSLSAEKGRIFVLLVNDQNVTERRDVMMGRLHDGMRVVTEGLSADDWVITPALKELRPGTTVTPDKAETPAK
jgi:multidrug efflux system membrane fusion protein